MQIFLFTDIEGSTEKWEKHKEAMKKALDRHDTILKENIKSFGGRVIKHTGDGIFAAFEGGRPLQCALEIQKQLLQEDWGVIGELRIRIGIHTGEAEKRGDDYFGPVVNRTARVMTAAWGGQTLLTSEVKKLCNIPAGGEIKDLGIHLLKDLGEPEQLYGLVHPDVLQKFPPLHSLSAHQHNLSPQATPFIDREEEIEKIQLLMEDPSCRLLTLIGPGGIGKTRLALQAAAEKIDSFHHGVYFVPLAPLTLSSAQFLVFTIADAINFSFYSREDPKVQLLNYLREKEMLLLMDNFEHLIEEVDLLAEILKHSPQTQIIVTSRERLNLQSEWTFEVRGMVCPESDSVTRLEDYSAVQLFLQTAKRVKPDFAITDDDKPYIVNICQLVDGIPLAIELAASWVRVLSLNDITYEINRNIDFLKTTLRDIPERHRSLRAVFEYSWELLSDEEKKIFRRMSVFQGSFSRKSAEKVTGTSLAIISSLVDKSLLRRSSSGRYEMLNVLKLYGDEKLSQNANEKEEILGRRSKYYAEFLSKMEDELLGRRQKNALEKIGLDIENIRASWNWALKKGKEEELKKFLDGLFVFYERRSWFQEGKEIFEKAERLLQTNNLNRILGKVLVRLGAFYLRLGLFQEAGVKLNQGLEISRRYDDKKDIAFSLNNLGAVARILGKYREATDYFQESLKIRKKIGNQSGIATSLANLGNVAFSQKDFKEAKKLFQESFEIFRKIEHQYGIAASYNKLGVVTFALEDYEEAKKLHQDALTIEKDIGDQWGVAASLNNLGNIARTLGEYDDAQDLYQRGLDILKEIGDRRGVALLLSNLGLVTFLQKDYQKAKRLHKECLKLREELGITGGRITTLTNLANTELALRNQNESKKYFQEALRLAIEIDSMSQALSVLIELVDLMVKEDEIDKTLDILALCLHSSFSDKEMKDKVESLLAKFAEHFSPQQVEVVRKGEKIRDFEEIVTELLK